MVADSFRTVPQFRIPIAHGHQGSRGIQTLRNRPRPIDRFRGIVFAAVKASRKTNSPIPTWAEAKVIEAMDVPDFSGTEAAKA